MDDDKKILIDMILLILGIAGAVLIYIAINK